jgi:hypothetical protein
LRKTEKRLSSFEMKKTPQKYESRLSSEQKKRNLKEMSLRILNSKKNILLKYFKQKSRPFIALCELKVFLV